MKHISSLKSGIVLGSAGVLMMSVITGCESHQEQQQQNKFVVIEKLTNGKYVVVEEMPTDGPSRALIREKDENGMVTERLMSEAEMKALAEQEYQKVQNGTSETTQPNSGGEGMGLAGTILAVAAGSLLGNMVANALFNNSNFAKNATNSNRSAYSRSAAQTSKSSSSPAKKSFFGSSTSKSSSSSSTFGG